MRRVMRASCGAARGVPWPGSSVSERMTARPPPALLGMHRSSHCATRRHFSGSSQPWPVARKKGKVEVKQRLRTRGWSVHVGFGDGGPMLPPQKGPRIGSQVKVMECRPHDLCCPTGDACAVILACLPPRDDEGAQEAIDGRQASTCTDRSCQGIVLLGCAQQPNAKPRSQVHLGPRANGPRLCRCRGDIL